LEDLLMARCKLVGLTKRISSVLILNSEGKLKQHRFQKGKEMELDSSQLTPHVQRAINKKAIKLVMLEENIVTPVVLKEKPIVVDDEEFCITTGVNTFETDKDLDESGPKKRRGRKKKVEDTEVIDLDEDEGTL